MVQIPVMCPRCGSWSVDPVKARNFREFRHRFLGRILYQCEDCPWRGHVVIKRGAPPIVWAAIAIVALVLLIALLKG